MSAIRSTKRCAAAAAGFGMVLASFAGAAASATASTQHATHRHPVTARRVSPDVPNPTGSVTASVAAPVDIPIATVHAGTPTVLPTATITDPGIVASGDVITLKMYRGSYDTAFVPATAPTIIATGAGVSVSSPGVVNAGAATISFTVTKATAGTPATYTVSGATVVGDPTVRADSFDLTVEVGTTGSGSGIADVATAPDVAWGAVTSIIPAAYGQTAPDTAAVLFRGEEGTATPDSVVLVSDSEPQDAESANFLATEAGTSILLTDPSTLSPAVSSVLNDYGSIRTVYIVGGTSVVSAAVQSELEAENYTVVRLAGADQYATNHIVVSYVASVLGDSGGNLSFDYSQTEFNDTSGNSSAPSTDVGSQRTAIVVSGAMDSYQDGVVSGPLSYGEDLPVILTTPTGLSASARSLLISGDYKQVIVLGGPSAVADSVIDQLTASVDSGGAGVTAFRIAGQDASDTSTKLATFMWSDAGLDEFYEYDDGVTDGGALIARGTGFQDALAAGPYGGGDGFTPILLTENATTLGAPLTAYLKNIARYDYVFAVQAIGGPLSVTPAVQQAASDAEFSGLVP